ncbi:DUF6314 family protein [Streptomyces sp. MB09-02B]|uniref:DUF6314 family protein n=1 Tax=Streptomyces sp. MB09-02B TaxID=3028667 RepID=UPI0029BC26C4|nr:DUF6314 family protein [Streptomyces sp. MB09-02B]MDX3640861.1 DUF6314 family protein [Streptomyces sp. MB09-02B]
MSGFLPVPDASAHLRGRWRVLRSVRDLASGAEGEFSGATVFSPLDDGGLLHRETGTFVWQGVPRPAERTLRFLPGAAPGAADVRFADGRPFHDLDLTTGRWRTDHPCAADLYRGEFEVYDEDRWRTTWRVGGPAKDLLLVTDYTRDRSAGDPASTARRPTAGSSGPRGPRP